MTTKRGDRFVPSTVYVHVTAEEITSMDAYSGSSSKRYLRKSAFIEYEDATVEKLGKVISRLTADVIEEFGSNKGEGRIPTIKIEVLPTSTLKYTNENG